MSDMPDKPIRTEIELLLLFYERQGASGYVHPRIKESLLELGDKLDNEYIPADRLPKCGTCSKSGDCKFLETLRENMILSPLRFGCIHHSDLEE